MEPMAGSSSGEQVIVSSTLLFSNLTFQSFDPLSSSPFLTILFRRLRLKVPGCLNKFKDGQIVEEKG